MRWGQPEPLEIDKYNKVSIDGTSIYVHNEIKEDTNARIDLVTGGVGTKLIFVLLAASRM